MKQFWGENKATLMGKWSKMMGKWSKMCWGDAPWTECLPPCVPSEPPMRVSSPPSMCFKLKESFWKPKEQIYNINFYTVSEKWYKTGVKWDNWNVRFDVKCELVALKCKESSYGWWEPGGEAGAAVSPLWWGLAEPSWRLIELLCRTRTLVLRHSVRWSSDRLVGWK